LIIPHPSTQQKIKQTAMINKILSRGFLFDDKLNNFEMDAFSIGPHH